MVRLQTALASQRRSIILSCEMSIIPSHPVTTTTQSRWSADHQRKAEASDHHSSTSVDINTAVGDESTVVMDWPTVDLIQSTTRDDFAPTLEDVVLSFGETTTHDPQDSVCEVATPSPRFTTLKTPKRTSHTSATTPIIPSTPTHLPPHPYLPPPTHLPAHTHLPPPKGKQTVIWDHTPRFGSSVANNFLSLQTGSKYNLTARKGQWLAIISLEIQLG